MTINGQSETKYKISKTFCLFEIIVVKFAVLNKLRIMFLNQLHHHHHFFHAQAR